MVRFENYGSIFSKKCLSDSNQGHSPSRESVGFDINPAMSPVFEKGATERWNDLKILFF